MSDIFPSFYPCCQGPSNDGSYCACDAQERAIRAYIDGHPTPMTPEQREWCLDEIGSVEGYERKDYVGESDKDLARNVLAAWVDYCRDKGLL